MTAPLRVLVVGAGMYVTGRGTRGPGTVLPALAQLSRSGAVGPVTVVATSPANARPVAEATDRVNAMLRADLRVEYRPIHGSLAETIRDLEIDGAIVSVPDHLHHDVADALLSRGVHCLIVKPLAPTLAEARALVRRQEERNLYAAVEFHKRFDEQNLAVRKAIRDGRLGRPAYMVVQFSQRIDIPLRTFQSWAARTNIFQYLGVHYADLIWFLTGFRPVRAAATGTRGLLDGHGIQTYDSVHAMIEWRDPRVAGGGGGGGAAGMFVSQIATGWIDPGATSAMSDQRFSLVGTEGRMELDQKDRGIELVTGAGIEHVNPYFSTVLDDPDGAPAFSGYGFKSIERFARDVLDIRAGRTSPAALEGRRPTLRDALVSTAVVDAVNRSLAAQGAWTPVEETA